MHGVECCQLLSPHRAKRPSAVNNQVRCETQYVLLIRKYVLNKTTYDFSREPHSCGNFFFVTLEVLQLINDANTCYLVSCNTLNRALTRPGCESIVKQHEIFASETRTTQTLTKTKYCTTYIPYRGFAD